MIAPGIPGRQVRYRPHLFSREQLRAIFAAADRIVATPYGGRREVIIPVIFLYLGSIWLVQLIERKRARDSR